MREYRLFDPVYRSGIRLLVGKFKDMRKHIRKYDSKFDPDEAGAYCIELESSGIFIWIPEFGSRKSYGRLAHEAIHAAHTVMRRHDIPINADNSEVVAYYVEFILRGFMKKLKKREKKKRKK